MDASLTSGVIQGVSWYWMSLKGKKNMEVLSTCLVEGRGGFQGRARLRRGDETGHGSNEVEGRKKRGLRTPGKVLRVGVQIKGEGGGGG